MSLEKWPWSNVEPREGEHELFSIAVSLKRIADRMEATSSIFENGHGQVNVSADVNANVALNG